MSLRQQYNEVTQAFVELLTSTNPMEKQAAVDEVNSFVRMMVREDGIQRRYMPFPAISYKDLTPQLDETLAQVRFKEPMSPGASTIPYNGDPIGWFIKGDRFLLTFQRIATPAFMKDVALLRTYPYDIRQVISDNALRDMLAHEDKCFFDAVNAVLGSRDGASPMTGEVQYVGISGGLTRDGLKAALQILPSLTPHFETQTIILNNVTHKEILAWNFHEYGGQGSQEMLESGTVKENLLGKNWIVTIKRNLVPDNTMYLFADPRCVGVAGVLEDVTMYVETKGFKIQWFMWEEVGACIANGGGVARVDFVV